MSSARALVLALGNPLAGEDGFGSAVLARLARDSTVTSVAELVDAHTDLLAHLDRLAAAGRVVLVDAVLLPRMRGDVVVLSQGELAEFSAEASSAHQVSPLVALQLLARLYPEAHPSVSLVGYCVEAVRAGPSPIDEAVIAAGAAAVRKELKLFVGHACGTRWRLK
jgi:coenzyme F420 hydrogenase subunit delta